jgi:hypothetical protein
MHNIFHAEPLKSAEKHHAEFDKLRKMLAPEYSNDVANFDEFLIHMTRNETVYLIPTMGEKKHDRVLVCISFSRNALDVAKEFFSLSDKWKLDAKSDAPALTVFYDATHKLLWTRKPV